MDLLFLLRTLYRRLVKSTRRLEAMGTMTVFVVLECLLRVFFAAVVDLDFLVLVNQELLLVLL